jgi:hypothetical protein
MITLEPRIMRQLHRPGSFLRIPLADGSFGYGRMLELPFDAFYDYRTTSPDSDLDLALVA